MKDIVIVDAVRSAVGRAHKGTLRYTRPDDLAGEVIQGLMKRNPQVKPELVEDLVLGCAMPEGEQGLNVARIAGMLGGLPETTGALTINRFCSSGLQAIAIAASHIAAGWMDVAVAGGVESMSMVPMSGNKPSMSPWAMECCPEVYTPMGTTAENVAKKYEIGREEQDQFAFDSQMKAKKALEEKVFQEEIVPVHGVFYEGTEKKTVEFTVDELPRPQTTLEGLGKLRPAFSKTGSVTAGNASPLSDGAAAALVMTKEKADELGLEPMAYFRHFTTVGVDPSIMGIGPIPAVKKLLSKTGLGIRDIDVVELNEAFASQSLQVIRELEIPKDRVNVHGGAIALGHPLGCTGAKLTATALHELKRRQGKYALVTMCIGGGMGAAGLFERA
ncbi:MAG: acetyl-CoA C-acyltransferase [Sandaracinus sp.]|nr:acetyl-CoA C-acyltransferase [Myxococcales bacterium]MAT26558.1 acetyl-CoA C-acyltransferase [Sandaracinus sp.]HJL22315.1 thiolase family protein [Polyangiaceae bacterium LLY-WYZ-15_(1-7)]MBJ74522.1 acetyl-CoA C-acyltransferase [Sandaracinus sp.]HJL28664.1 thiolase family protein [Polyangiaceae bacterium LLY-WYZ-15_(1-7)]